MEKEKVIKFLKTYVPSVVVVLIIFSYMVAYASNSNEADRKILESQKMLIKSVGKNTTGSEKIQMAQMICDVKLPKDEYTLSNKRCYKELLSMVRV